MSKARETMRSAGFARLAGPGNGALASLFASGIADRFHFWLGLSGRRYTVSVAPVDHGIDECGLPDFDGFVLVSVVRSGSERWLLDAVAIERTRDRAAAIAAALAAGATEWHVHLLAGDRAMRADIAADLRRRHGAETLLSA